MYKLSRELPKCFSFDVDLRVKEVYCGRTDIFESNEGLFLQMTWLGSLCVTHLRLEVRVPKKFGSLVRLL